MRWVFIMIMSAALTACATFSGTSGQFSTTEEMVLPSTPANFLDTVIAVGEELGYQYSGGNRAENLVQLSDQPNFGESVIMGRSYTVQLYVSLQPDGRTVEIQFYSVGGRATAGAERSQERIREFRSALQARFGP